jgi:putative intracellular protease/amidase
MTIASPKGGEAPLDPISVDMFKEDGDAMKFFKEESAQWKSTTKLSDLHGKADEFDAIYYVGGHGRASACHETVSLRSLTVCCSNV